MKSKTKRNILVVGGGNSSYTLIALLSNAGHCVNLLTRCPERWSNIVKMHYVLPSSNKHTSLLGRIGTACDDPSAIVPMADIILLSVPVSQYRPLLHKLAPFIGRGKKVYLGAVYGQGGFNWMVNEVKEKYKLSNITMFSCGLLPWITRTEIYGHSGNNYGPKAVNVATVSPSSEFMILNDILFKDLCYSWFHTGNFLQADNFLSLTLSVDNQVIHLSRLYGLYLKHGGHWNNYSDIPMFYRDFDDLSAELLRNIDAEYTQIRNCIKSMFPHRDFRYMLDYLALERLSYKTSNTDIRESFVNSNTLGQIATPVVQNNNGEWIFDKGHRFFKDDVYYGLCIAKWIAEKLNVDTPIIDNILSRAQGLLCDRIIDHGRLVLEDNTNTYPFKIGIPSVYGYDTIEEIMD